jgi:hypothetical protein
VLKHKGSGKLRNVTPSMLRANLSSKVCMIWIYFPNCGIPELIPKRKEINALGAATYSTDL